ncbi:hypothetical protein XPA_005962 [Xanthoria parietina]
MFGGTVNVGRTPQRSVPSEPCVDSRGRPETHVRLAYLHHYAAMLRSHHQIVSHPANSNPGVSSNPFGNVVVVLRNIGRLLFLNAFALWTLVAWTPAQDERFELISTIRG